MEIEIKNRYDDAVIFSGEFESLLLAVEEAIRKGANLRGANLRGANLRGADLYGADLYGADLHGADLRGADGVNKLHTSSLFLLREQPGKIRAYKMVNADGFGPFNGGIKYEIGKSYEVKDANTDEQKQCAPGISLASADWILPEFRQDYRILIAEFEAADIAAIPIGSNGKFRVYRCTIVGEKKPEELGIGVVP